MKTMNDGSNVMVGTRASTNQKNNVHALYTTYINYVFFYTTVHCVLVSERLRDSACAVPCEVLWPGL